ncbi:hypothetical protein GGQ96_003215 [Sphingomonas abaci]|uniref:Uncharacterized protein n=1 Tax=Sphingomonas abaci TaxID=237611 RepID=A0A7W7AMV4_9SPHN|nr:hypothetical protein [Sphingomonas abaci]
MPLDQVIPARSQGKAASISHMAMDKNGYAQVSMAENIH